MINYKLDRYVSSSKAQELLGLGRRRFDNLIKKKIIKYYICPSSSKKLYNIEDLLDFLKLFRENGYGHGV